MLFSRPDATHGAKQEKRFFCLCFAVLQKTFWRRLQKAAAKMNKNNFSLPASHRASLHIEPKPFAGR